MKKNDKDFDLFIRVGNFLLGRPSVSDEEIEAFITENPGQEDLTRAYIENLLDSGMFTHFAGRYVKRCK